MVLDYKVVKDIYETRDSQEIKQALDVLLEIPNALLKPKIIEEILEYLEIKFLDDYNKISVFIAYNKSKIAGFVIAQIDNYFRSYGKKCATFGWLRAQSLQICKKLMNACENFAIDNGYRKIRGPINFPKGLGGLGIQVEGNDEKLLYGVAFNPLKLAEYLDQLGYKRDAEYICVYVSQYVWKKGKKIDNEIRLGHLSLEEIKERKEEILNLASSAFSFILPDHSGISKFEEVIKQYETIPNEYYKLPPHFNPRNHSNFPEFIEDWTSCDLENVVTWAHFAFSRKTGEIVGAIFCLPDLYQLWLGEPITRANVDTVFVKSNYSGKGIFSTLNNIGRITCGFNGVNYFEGTSIWNKNEKAVQSIFPHSQPFRKHIVFQKKLRTDRT